MIYISFLISNMINVNKCRKYAHKITNVSHEPRVNQLQFILLTAAWIMWKKSRPCLALLLKATHTRARAYAHCEQMLRRYRDAHRGCTTMCDPRVKLFSINWPDCLYTRAVCHRNASFVIQCIYIILVSHAKWRHDTFSRFYRISYRLHHDSCI